MNTLRQLAQEIIRECENILNDYCDPSQLKIWNRYLNPETGRLVEITSGYYLDPIYNRLSNFWNWREVLDNGELGEGGRGYWRIPQRKDALLQYLLKKNMKTTESIKFVIQEKSARDSDNDWVTYCGRVSFDLGNGQINNINLEWDSYFNNSHDAEVFFNRITKMSGNSYRIVKMTTVITEEEIVTATLQEA